MPTWLLVVAALVPIISTVGSVVVTITAHLSKGNFASFKLELIELMDRKLEAFMKRAEYELYVNAHAKLHQIVDEEILKLRDFKHDASAELRANSLERDDLRETLQNLRADLKDIRDRQNQP